MNVKYNLAMWSNYDKNIINVESLLLYLIDYEVHFIHIWYSNQVPCVGDACKIAFGPMPNLSNYGNMCDISEKKRLILFIFGTVINHKRGLMRVKYTLALCQNVAFMSIVL